MKVYIVGTGMDGCNSLTKEAADAVNKADILIGAERMLKPFQNFGKEMLCTYDPHYISKAINSCNYTDAAVLMSGDCCFFSGAKRLLPLLEGHEVSIISGVSSVSYFCSKLAIPYEKMKFVTLHGRDSNITVNVKMNRFCFFLLGGNMSAADICRRLCSYGLGSVKVCIGADLGYPNENIIIGNANELVDVSVSGLAVMITENDRFLRHTPSAIDDLKFIRSNIPMTKSEVRCIAVSKLNICCDSVVWDIGCGTGSFSVEAAFRCPDGQVIAFDKKPEAVKLTEQNSLLFGCDNIKAYEGECPAILADIRSPDKVFIGGSSGNMQGIFKTVYSKNPIAEIVVTAVSLETLHEAVSCFEMYGKNPEITQIAVTHTKKIGSHTMLQAQNPVFVISGNIS